MDDRLALKEQTLRAQFTAMETALSQSQAQSSGCRVSSRR